MAGFSSFFGGNVTDILWRNTSGNTVIWLMNGTTPVGNGSLPAIPTSWQVMP